MADARLKVTFTSIDIINDGDSTGKGQFYYSLKVDGSVVASRTVKNPIKVGDGGEIILGSSSTVTKSGAPGTKLVISGSLSEKDGLFAGKDESDSFSVSETAGSNWGTGHPGRVNLVDNNLNVMVNYIVERV